MRLVRIVHPKAGESVVPESAVPHWIGRGWMPAEEPDEPAVPPSDGKQKEKPRGSRRRSTDQESE